MSPMKTRLNSGIPKGHFARVNELQKEQRYYFKFLSPGSYDSFFKALREKTYKNFRSELEAKLEE